jgi:hypothetical protein
LQFIEAAQLIGGAPAACDIRSLQAVRASRRRVSRSTTGIRLSSSLAGDLRRVARQRRTRGSLRWLRASVRNRTQPVAVGQNLASQHTQTLV